MMSTLSPDVKDRPLLTEKELAFKLNVSIRTVQKWRQDGRGPKPCYIEGCVRYSQEAIFQYIESCYT